MQHHDVLILGGGPAGAACGWRLARNGLDVLVVDKAEFPRPKLCAGWITPAVLEELEIDPAEYRQGRVLQEMTGFRVGRIDGPWLNVAFGRTVSFGIRRAEFDHYLLCRSGARLQLGEAVETIRRSGGNWVVNERFESPMLVAAGGHFCPVRRLLGIESTAETAVAPAEDRRNNNCRTSEGDSPIFVASCHKNRDSPLIASQEIEFELSPAQWAACPVDPAVPEIYFCRDLLGYGWCIRKGNYLNVGLGRAERRRLPEHVARFSDFLRRQGRIGFDLPGRFQGHAYLLYEQSARPLVDEGVVWIGDAAGLAYASSGEGIRPAVESGLIAAEVISKAQGDYGRERLEPYRVGIEARFGPRAARPVDRTPSALRRWLAGRLLRSRWFVRDVLVSRWFLHRHEPALGP